MLDSPYGFGPAKALKPQDFLFLGNAQFWKNLSPAHLTKLWHSCMCLFYCVRLIYLLLKIPKGAYLQPKFLPALLFSLALLALLYFALQPPAQEPQAQVFFASVRPGAFHMVDAGGSTSFFAPFSVESSGAQTLNITLACSQERMPSYFCVLEHPSISGFDADGFKRGYDAALQRFGLESNRVPLSRIHDCGESIIVVPTGAPPAQMDEILQSTLPYGSRVLLIGAASNFSIDSHGQVQKSLQNDSNHTSGAFESLSPPAASSLYSFGYSIALSQIYTQGSPWSASRILELWDGQQNSSLVATATLTPAQGYCRLIYEARSKDGTSSFGMLQSPPLAHFAQLAGTSLIFIGQPARFEAWVEPLRSSPLALYATATDFSTQRTRKKIFEGSVESGWLGSIELENFTSPGHYLVSIEDQFSRVYAKSLLRVQNLSVSLVSIDSQLYTFAASIDDHPINDAIATVLLEGSNSSMQYSIRAGTFSVAARPSSGEGAFIVGLLGTKVRIPFSTQPQFSLLVAPAALLLAAFLIFFLHRRQRKRAYWLRVPDAHRKPQQQITLTQGEFLRGFDAANAHFGWHRQPLEVPELAAGLQKFCSSRAMPVHLSLQSVEEALSLALSNGSVVSHGGFYAPASWNLRMEPAAIARTISNILVQKGCIPKAAKAPNAGKLPQNKSQKHVCTPCIDARCPFEKVRITPYSIHIQKTGIPIAAGSKNILAFGSRNQMDIFLSWLKSGQPQAAKFSLLIKNRKFFLCVAGELGGLL